MSTCTTCGTHLRNVDGVCPTCVARTISTFLSTPPNSDEDAEVPGYELHEIIGRGGMGIVFRATRLEDEHVVAVKLLPAHLAGHEEIADRFAREAHALAAFDHPHVLRVLDSGITLERRLFLVTEFAAGGDLAKRLQHGALPVDEARRMFNEVLHAIREAHRQGIVHRDIKPANILLDEHNSVRVGDFSLAKLLRDGAAPQLTLTQSADVFGTPYYIAPEVRRGAVHVDERADIFSLGVLLHELLTGRVPIGNYEPASSSAKVPRAVDRLIARCLREDPAKRPASVFELIVAFAKCFSPRKVVVQVIVGLEVALVLLAGGMWLWQRLAHDKIATTSVIEATKEQPWTNSLGMKFVPVPGTKVLFCIHEARRSDYGAFAESDPASTMRDAWRRPLSAVSPEHPVTPLSVMQAVRFCTWLTDREHRSHSLPAQAGYRLPTNDEWDHAAVLVELDPRTPVYVWGSAWPPPRQPLHGNYAGIEVRSNGLPTDDGFRFTAPVGSFAPNALGLFDLGGNVAEWCIAPVAQAGGEASLRGGSWDDSDAESLRLDARKHPPAVLSVNGAGFRVVLDPGE